MTFSPADLLGPEGPFARGLPGFAPRPQQREMAEAVADTLAAGGLLVGEAGTGTGKTFAYLVPVLQGADKVVISTGTKALQDQLYFRDIPLVRDILASPARSALLKGRGNYLCLHRLEHVVPVREMRAAARRLAERAWSRQTDSGETAELLDIPPGDPFFHQITSTADNCLGTECAFHADCFVVKARRAAQEADVVVINHHLLFSDILLREEGFGELLPEAHAFVIDEAHQLPELASRFFGSAVSGRQLFELARDARRAAEALGGELDGLEPELHDLERAVEHCRQVLDGARRPAPWRPAVGGRALGELRASLASVGERLETAAGRDKALDHCRQRLATLDGRLAGFEPAEADEPDGYVRWYECGARSFTLHQTPMDFADTFRRSIDRYRSAWVFTSATLAVDSSFRHFTGRLGIDDAGTARWDSPFDFRSNALLYLPEGMPEPNSPHHTAAVMEAARPVIAASGGGVFLLFTSHQALQEAARLLGGAGLGRRLFVQGMLPHNELLERFRRAGDGVLLATGSFWEGVDVRGPALSCVVIDKLPFAPPDDPVLQARAALIKARGGNAFRDHQIPAAVVALKQGVGRLIRDAGDRGVLMLCDPRLLTRSYGGLFLDNLPPMPRTRALAEVERFFAVRQVVGDDAIVAPAGAAP